MFSIPQVAIGGALLIESYFGIPGIGKATYEAIVTGDQPVLKAVVSLTAILFVLGRDAERHPLPGSWIPRVTLK